MQVSLAAGEVSKTFTPVFKYPNSIVNVQITHFGAAAYYGVAAPNADGTITLYMKPGASGGVALFFVKITGT